MRFFYNLGVEYFKYLRDVHGYGGVMAMIDGDNVNSTYEQTPSVASDVDTAAQHQLANDFQQFNLDVAEIETQSPSKVIFFIISQTNQNFKIDRYFFGLEINFIHFSLLFFLHLFRAGTKLQ